MEPSEQTRLNNELLKADDKPKEPKEIKRNSKEALINNILKVVEKYDLEFDFSDTKLKRMNKENLTKLLAEVMEQSVKIDMAKSVGVDPRGGGKVVTLGALRMIHNIAAVGFEKGFNQFASPYVGMESQGFAESLSDPSIQPSVDECLTEIAAENPEILEYFDSPYTRLALVWCGALMTCLKKKQTQLNTNGIPPMGPRTSSRATAGRTSSGRGQTERKVDSHYEPRVQTI